MNYEQKKQLVREHFERLREVKKAKKGGIN
jgi:hypothetical protein